MIIRYRETKWWWRILSLGITTKYKADVYRASDNDVTKLEKWLTFQGIKYSTDKRAYYTADSVEYAELYKPKITIHVRTEDKLAALKLTWS